MSPDTMATNKECLPIIIVDRGVVIATKVTRDKQLGWTDPGTDLEISRETGDPPPDTIKPGGRIHDRTNSLSL